MLRLRDDSNLLSMVWEYSFSRRARLLLLARELLASKMSLDLSLKNS